MDHRYGYFYFSGTNNAKSVIKRIQTLLEAETDLRALHQVEDSSWKSLAIKTQDYPQLVFVCPVYALGLPCLFRKFLRRIPQGKNQPVMLIACRGEKTVEKKIGDSGMTTIQARKILERRGYKVIIAKNVGLPQNVTFLLSPATKNDCQALFAKINQELQTYVADFKNQRINHDHIGIGLLLFSWMFNMLYCLVGRRALGLSFIADTTCTRCQQCIRECPVDAINMTHNGITWNHRCQGCLRCFNHCPSHSIQVSPLRMLILTLPSVYLFPFRIMSRSLVFSIFTLPIPSNFSLLGLGYGLVGILCYVVNVLVWTFLYYWLLRGLEKITLFRKIFAWSWTKKLNRYTYLR